MKLSVYNPTGSRVTISGNGRFAGVVLRSLFATRGHQEFDVASQEHADWLIRHINAACPAAQVRLLDEPIPAEPEVADAVAEPVPDAEPAEVATKKAVGKKPKVAAEIKE